MATLLLRLLILWIPSLAIAAPHGGIGQFAGELIEPVTILSNFISSASFIIGAMLLVSALMRYMQHRVNPLASPISTVLILLILGIMLIALPFVYIFLGAGIPFSLFGN